MDKAKLIKTEYDRIAALYAKIPANKRKLVEGLLQNAAYMSATLQELQAIVNEQGAVLVGVNGNGFTTVQENPAQKSYTALIGKYSAVMDKLDGLLPAEQAESKLTAFIDG